MKNYKIKVNDEAESKEAQELFFELWYKIECFVASRFPRWLATTDQGEEYWYSTGYEIEASLNGFQELTLPQLRDLVAQSKPKEQGLISGKEALIALANGEEVECRAYEKNWINAGNYNHCLGLFFDESFEFRLKPKTITLNGIEVPAPFEPKVGEEYWFIADYTSSGYGCTQEGTGINSSIGKWKSEEEIKQVVAALRQIFGGV